MTGPGFRRLLDRESRKKTFPGYKLDIDIAPIGDSHDARIWHQVDAAVHIPSNDRNLLSLPLAREMGVVAFDEKGDVVDNMVELQWKRRDLFPKSRSYGCRARFAIQANLPCEMIFGEHDPLNLLPGFPSPFEGAGNKHDFDQCYGSSKQRRNSWAKAATIVLKSSSWVSDKSKTKSAKSSTYFRMSPIPTTTNTFNHHKPDPPELVDSLIGSKAIRKGTALSNDTYILSVSAAPGEKNGVIENCNMHAAETNTTLATIPLNEGAKLRGANRSLQNQIPQLLGGDFTFRHVIEWQRDDLEIALKPSFPLERAFTPMLSISETPEIAPLRPRSDDSVLQLNHMVPPGDNSVFIEPTSSWEQSKRIARDWESFDQGDDAKGKSDAAKGKTTWLESLLRENSGPNLSHSVTSIRRPENTDEKSSKTITSVQNEGGFFMNSLQSIHVKLMEPERIAKLQSGAHEKQAITRPRSRTRNFEQHHEKKHNTDECIARLSAAQGAVSVFSSDEQQPTKQPKPLAELEIQMASPTRTDTLNLITESIGPLALEQSAGSLTYSRNSDDFSDATERPAQLEIATPPIEPNLLSGRNIAEAQSTGPEAKQHSELSGRSISSCSKKHPKKHGKAPRIRSCEGNPSQKVDLIPAKGANEYWEYDEELNAYYHIETDTGSTFWYEDSSDESEE